METREAVPPSNADSGLKWLMTDLFDELRELTALELADVVQHIKRIRAARGDRPSPELVSQVVATAERLYSTYAYCVPIPLIRAGLVDVPRTLLDAALFEAESRDLLRMEPVDLPSPFVEVGAGIPHKRGLLYWIVPFGP